MNELKLVSKTQPAVVTFNYDAINTHLDEVLKKYSGLVFTEETVSDCKKTIADLRKGQKSLDAFRLKTKKELTKSVKDFEDQCKLLSNKFNTIIEPIIEQADEFEIKRKANKEAEIQVIINTLSTERVLESKYSTQLIMIDQMLNKGTTIKSIKEELTKQADLLLSQQNMEKSNIELIKSKVALVNSEYDIVLLENTYLRMMEYKEVPEITAQITNDAEDLKKRNEELELQKVIKAEKVEAERIAAEARKAERAERERISKERQAIDKNNREIAKAQFIKEVSVAESEKITSPLEQFKSEPNEQTPIKKSIDEEVFVDKYEIEGTEAQLNAMEDYLTVNVKKWSVLG